MSAVQTGTERHPTLVGAAGRETPATPAAAELARLEARLREQWAALLRADPARADKVNHAARFVHQALVALRDDTIV